MSLKGLNISRRLDALDIICAKLVNVRALSFYGKLSEYNALCIEPLQLTRYEFNLLKEVLFYGK